MSKRMKNISSNFIILSLFIFGIARQSVAGPVEQLVTDTTAAAERGDVRAQVTLGIMYERGIGVSPDSAKAFEWFRAAATRDDPIGQSLMGRAYADARGVSHDDKQAFVWFRKGVQAELREFSHRPILFAGGFQGAIKAAESGNALAQVMVGNMYLTGHGVEQNDTEAVRWLTKGVERGLAGAENSLALMYQEGRGGLPKDTAKAMRLYRKAAEQIAKGSESVLAFICLNLIGQADCKGPQ